MDNNDSMKSQQTGGLKLMTVFIAVLALHVVVIGGFTVYHLMSGGSDADLTSTDKTHKGMTAADGTLPDPSQGDKSSASTSSTTSSSETAAAPANSTAPESDQAAPIAITSSPATTAPTTPAPASPASTITTPAAPAAVTSTPTPTVAPAPALAPVPTLTLNTPKPLQLTPPAEVADQSQATGPISPSLMPPPDVAPVSAPLTTLAPGPVHMPPAVSSTVAPKLEREHEHQQIYVVKITDSYKKIAKAHHVTVAQLKEANHIKGDTLHTGQKLVIPSEKKLVAENAQASSTLSSAPSGPILSESVSPMTTA